MPDDASWSDDKWNAELEKANESQKLMNSKIKVSELFYSIQGEGAYMGTPSVFLRTFGCNFTCSGFGMKKGELSIERDAVNPEEYDSYKALPLVHTGCDSYPSWDPRFKHFSPVMTVEAIVDEMQKLLPDGNFGWDKHLIITGGEPLLGWQKSYPDLFDEIINRGMDLTNITFETNGTQTLKQELITWFANNSNIEVMFSVSAKLGISGEKWEDAIKPEVLYRYCTDVHNSRMYLKFVVAGEDDLNDIKKAVKEYEDYYEEMDSDVIGFNNMGISVYLMPCGGTNATYQMTERQVADLCLKEGYRFSPRLQIPLFKNAWGT
jgi:7-carboxy-7-deazaguanine synthase